MSEPRERALRVFRLGRVEYEDGLTLQKAFFQARKGKVVGDTLLLLEHPPVLTLGRGARGTNILASQEVLAEANLRIHETDRGGDVTYHGPGQVVGYPIVDLSPDRQDVRRYVRDLEEMMILTCADFGLKAHRIDGWTGVWLGEKGRDARKIGAIGVHISRWITSHGFAFNVNTELSHFGFIVPCGISQAEGGVTSLQQELGAPQSMVEVEDRLMHHLGARLNAKLVPGRPDRRTISVAILRHGRTGLEALIMRRHHHRGGFWQQVTGTIERGETPEQCAVRELGEEAGFEAEVRPLGYTHCFAFGEPRPDRQPRIFEETAFWCMVGQGLNPKLDHREHAALPELAPRWITSPIRIVSSLLPSKPSVTTPSSNGSDRRSPIRSTRAPT
ncbi:MAG: lipoyl(octanoyl) transferase LipB, partial [Myxococcales bacterium]